ncbi:MAG TPA: MAPEG family protein, partial [Steroidobacteraceae bacterium]|nr:MAPEG family protein [Steroidobacteraceae bacterium]
FALVALTLLSVARLARMRFAAAKAGRVDPRFYKVFKGDGEPPELAATSRNVANLYEMPTLFYAGTAIAFAAGESGVLLVGLGWAYVALRALHSAIHVTNNRVMWRFRAFFASWVVLLAYWAVLGAAIARAPATG